jgi:hypothetical protein
MFDDSWLSTHSNLAGLRLVDIKRVGLPVYSAQLDVLTEERRELPLVSEYCLRLVAAGVAEKTTVASLLGISDSVASAALADLMRAGAVRGDEDALSVTDYGKDVVSEYGEIVCNEAVWFVPFDSMLGKPHPWRRDQLLTARELVERGHGIEVFPFGAKPVWKDFKPLEVWQCLANLRPDKILPRLVSIRDVRRAPLRFIAAVAAGYRGDRGESHVAFFVDGRLLDDHGRQFADRGGLKRPMFKVLGSTLSPSAVQLRAAAGRRLQLEKSAPSGKLSLQPTIDTGLDLSPHLLGGVLLQGVKNATVSIALSSTKASPIASEVLIAELISAAARKVRIRIALQKSGDGSSQSVEVLAALGHANGDIKVSLVDDLAVTHLLIDDSLAVVGSDDWLAVNLSSERALGQRWRVGTISPEVVRAERERLDWAKV